MHNKNRKNFEREYKDWILLMSKDAARRLIAMHPEKRKKVLEAYNNLIEPRSVFRKPLQLERIESLAGEKISSFIVIETEAIAFFPSVYGYAPSILDFAVAMNRRFFCQGLWFPIISLNSEYIRQSSDRILSFALEHEFEMSRIYQEISTNLRTLSQNEKRYVVDSAHKISKERLRITKEELIEDERLMCQLSITEPLLPKPYAERAMLYYLEVNLPELQSFGLSSCSPEEEAFGKILYEEFHGWSEFSQKTYELFVREIQTNLREENKGYS